jgi:hypothetical protein
MTRHKYWILISLALIFLISGLLIWAGTPAIVQAQCGDIPPDSSCITCHEKEDPVFDQGEWHMLHGRKDCCAQCHGGNCSTMDKNLAHQGVVANPLDDIYTNCYHCHPDDYQDRAERFALALGITPSSRPTPTSVVRITPIDKTSLVMPQPALASGTSTSGIGVFLGILSLIILTLGVEFRYIFLHR